MAARDRLTKAQRAELPSTLERSEPHAQATWAKTHDAAVGSYGEGERAHRTAFASLKRGYEKVGDHWEPKAHPGPSDDRSADPAARGRRTRGGTAGGVDARASKAHLYEVAKRLDVRGRSRMGKAELVEAIDRANQREAARARRA